MQSVLRSVSSPTILMCKWSWDMSQSQPQYVTSVQMYVVVIVELDVSMVVGDIITYGYAIDIVVVVDLGVQIRVCD